MEKSDNTSTLILGVIIAIVIILMIIFAINITKNADLKKRNTIPKLDYSFEIQAMINGKQSYGLNYELYENKDRVQEGTLLKGYITEFTKLKNHTDYLLKITDEGYYDTEKICTIKDRTCIADLKSIGQVKATYLDYGDLIRVSYRIKDGFYRDFVICIQENTDKILRFDVQDSFKAENLLTEKYDNCYYPMNRTELNNKYTNLYQQNFTLEEYNKEMKTKLDSWQQLEFTDDELRRLDSIKLSEGFYDFNLVFEYDNRYDYRKGDRILIKFIDMYHSNEINNKNHELEIPLWSDEN